MDEAMKGLTGSGGEKHGNEKGFALIMVLIALLMLSVLGALSLLVMVSSLQGVANLKPEDRAFQVAEAALHVAHAKIVNDDLEAGPVSGEILGGDYTIEITPTSSTDFTVISEGSYESGGRTYRRKIREEVSYSGMQAFDVMRKYLLFAKNNINITLDDIVNLNLPVTVYGPIRAEKNVSIRNQPVASIGDGLTFNGDVEAVEKLYVETAPKVAGGLNTKILGDIRTGRVGGSNTGIVDLLVDDGWFSDGRIGAAANFRLVWLIPPIFRVTDKWDIYCGTLSSREGGGDIFLGNRVNQPGCEPVYIPQADFAYYKALAREQHKSTGKNFVDGDLNLNGRSISEFVPAGSSVAVIYATGNISVSNFIWDQTNIKATFVCEGDFTSTSTFTILNSLQCQVIAKHDATFNNEWDIVPQVIRENNAFFVWAGNNANINMGMWSGNSLQVTAMNDINVSSRNAFDLCAVRYRPPDVDVAGFPIDITVKDWRELPSEGT